MIEGTGYRIDVDQLSTLGSRHAYLSVIVVLCFLTAVALWWRNPLRRFPGPWYTTFTGFVLTRNTLAGQRLHYIHRLHQLYGPIVRISPDEIDVSDPGGFHQIHRIGSGFLKSAWYTRFRKGGINIFNAIDPVVHAKRRKVLARPFSKSSLRQHWETFVTEKARSTVSKIKLEADDGKTADVYKWFTLMTTDVIGKLSFGEDFDMVELGTKNELVRDMEVVSKMRALRAESGSFYPLLKIWYSGFSGKFEEAEERINRYSNTVVINARGSSLEKANIFTGILDGSTTKEDETISDIDATFEAGALVVAGSGTTAVTLTYLVWAVLSYRHVQRRLEEEVRSLGPAFSDVDLEALPYLNAVIEESLRLYGSAPGSLPRRVPELGLLVQGYFIPPGYIVETQAYTIHRRNDMFAKPDSFIPERWLEQTGHSKPIMCPFGAGSRVCLGIHLAYMEMRHTVANFFRECAGARLHRSTTASCMEMEHFFLIAPRGRKCEVTL